VKERERKWKGLFEEWRSSSSSGSSSSSISRSSSKNKSKIINVS